MRTIERRFLRAGSPGSRPATSAPNSTNSPSEKSISPSATSLAPPPDKVTSRRDFALFRRASPDPWPAPPLLPALALELHAPGLKHHDPRRAEMEHAQPRAARARPRRGVPLPPPVPPRRAALVRGDPAVVAERDVT